MLAVVNLNMFCSGFYEKRHIPQAHYYGCHPDDLTFRKKVASLKIIVSAHAVRGAGTNLSGGTVLIAKASGETVAGLKRTSEKTLDIHQFLVAKVGLKKVSQTKSENPVGVTYHDPCHLKKTLGVAAEPRAVLEANPGYHLKEMPSADACCGMGGSFNLQ